MKSKESWGRNFVVVVYGEVFPHHKNLVPFLVRPIRLASRDGGASPRDSSARVRLRSLPVCYSVAARLVGLSGGLSAADATRRDG